MNTLDWLGENPIFESKKKRKRKETFKYDFFPRSKRTKFFFFYLATRHVKFGGFFYEYDRMKILIQKDCKKLENPCNIRARTIFSTRSLNGEFPPLPLSSPPLQIYFPFSITLKKICFPIDAKRFPIGGDMQIVGIFIRAPVIFHSRGQKHPRLVPPPWKRRNFPPPVQPVPKI